jgi:hypothetical protein
MLRLGLAIALFLASGAHGTDLRFSAEDPHPERSVELRSDLWSALQQDADVREVADQRSGGRAQREWFIANPVHLHQNEDDVVVQGEGPILGANVTTFWIFAENRGRPKLLLKVPAHDLFIRAKTSHGYRVIEAVAVIKGRVVTLTYTFDGEQYTPHQN